MSTVQQPDHAAPPLLSLRDLVRIVRRHWRVLIIAPLLGILVAASWAALQPARYSSTTSALVSIGSGDNIGLALTADNLAKSKAQQYAQLGNSRAVAETAVQGLSFAISPGDALALTTVEAGTDSALLSVKAEGSEPARAQELATAWTTALAQRVADLETGNDPADAGVSTRGSVIGVEVLSEANAPTRPSWPNVPLALALGALAGLFLGLAYVLIRHLLDNKIRSATAIEERFGLSILGTIPDSPRTRGRKAEPENRILVATTVEKNQAQSGEHARFRITESLKELRTNIEFLRPDHAPRVITITSAHPGEGKTSVAANLALTIAQSGQPVVLVDGDLRRPVLAGTFGLVEGVGVTDVIVGHAQIDDVVQYLPGLPAFALIGAGRIPPNPSEILSSERFRDMVLALSEEALVIIDAPPLLPVTDAAILARRFDGCVLVVSAGRPTVEELEKAVSSVSKIGGEVLGVVLNRVPIKGPDANAYQYYGQSYYTGAATTQPDAD